MEIMTPGIKITVIDKNRDRSDGFIEFTVVASNGVCSASQTFYAQGDGFKNFADQLKDFPADLKSKIKLEIGGAELPWATYLMFEVFCYEPTGKSAKGDNGDSFCRTSL